MNASYCHSCGMPLDAPGAASPIEHFCIYCLDEHGQPKTWEQALEGVAAFLASWQPPAPPEEFRRRAEAFLSAMPAWADRAR